MSPIHETHRANSYPFEDFNTDLKMDNLILQLYTIDSVRYVDECVCLFFSKIVSCL